MPNYYRIIAKDIGVRNEFHYITCSLVNNIQLKLTILFKNKFSTKGKSVKDLIKVLNQPKPEQKKNENQYKPKKVKIPNILKKDYIKKKEDVQEEQKRNGEEESKEEEEIQNNEEQ